MTKRDTVTYEREIIRRLNNDENVYLESSTVKDIITAYEKDTYGNVIFTTTACIFPKRIDLREYDGIDTEEFGGELFVHIW